MSSLALGTNQIEIEARAYDQQHSDFLYRLRPVNCSRRARRCITA